MQMTEHTQSPVQIFDDLCDNRKPIYFANVFQNSKISKGRPAGDIIIGIVDSATKRRMTLAIPKNSIVCVTDQVGHATLRDNPDIRKYLGNGVLELYTPEEFRNLQADDPDYIESSADQLQRLNDTLEGAPTQLDNDSPVAPAPVLDITVRPEVQNLIAKVQFETETEKALLQDIKLLAPFSEAEKQNLIAVTASIPADRPKLRATLTSLDATTSPAKAPVPAVKAAASAPTSRKRAATGK
jgi:hypothetical protein